jgi:hypothetical protein
VDFSRIKTIPIRQRTHKVTRGMLGTVPEGDGFAAFYDSLPEVLAAGDLKRVAQAIARASSDGGEIILAMGAHPIKCGLSPLIIDLMERGILTAVVMNGAGAIHDFEMGYIGETSEDVAETLRDGSFGMIEETGRMLNEALTAGAANNDGAGEALGRFMAEAGLPHADVSILAAGHRLGVDVTVHIAVGTDTIHVHPAADGAALGATSHRDLMRLADHVARLQHGAYINLGSAVVLPEVFLKVLSAVRNMGHEVTEYTAVNMDMIRQYRPSENVLKRPALTGADAVHLTGHHELMLPLLARAVALETERMTG